MEYSAGTFNRLHRITQTESELNRCITDYRIKLSALTDLLDRQMYEIEQKNILIQELSKKNYRESDQYKRRISYLETKQNDLSQRYSNVSRISTLENMREQTTITIELDLNNQGIEVLGQSATGQRVTFEVERDKGYSFSSEEDSTLYDYDYDEDYEDISSGSRTFDVQIAFN